MSDFDEFLEPKDKHGITLQAFLDTLRRMTEEPPEDKSIRGLREAIEHAKGTGPARVTKYPREKP